MKWQVFGGLLALATSCGAAAPKDMKAVNESVYQTDYATVWNALVAVMVYHFHEDGIWVEDGSKGVIVSKWKAISASLTQEDQTGETDVQSVSSRGYVRKNAYAIAGDMIQIRLRIEQKGALYRVIVEGEGARRSQNTSVLKPYRRGSDEEPIWVGGRIQDIRGDIYDHLKAFAVLPPRDEEAPTPGTDPNKVPALPPPNLPIN